MPTEKALGILINGRGASWDPELVDIFVDLIRREGEALHLRGRMPQLPVPLIRPREPVALAKGE